MNRALLSALAIMIVFSWRHRETIAQDNPPPQNWNQALTDVAKSVNSTTWHAANYTPTITSTFAGAPNDKYDVITITRPPGATNMAWKTAGVFRNPRDDGALIRPVMDNPVAPPAYPTPPVGACVGRVEGRQSIGSQYWVEVSVSLRPAPAPGRAAPARPWWGVEIGTPGPAAGSVILTDINGGVSLSDASQNMLGCDVAADDSLGDVRFTLDAQSGAYTWAITPAIPQVTSSDVWQNAPYEKTVNNIPTGQYTLTVTGPNNFQKQIAFAVIQLTLTAPTANQEFAIDIAGPTMPQVQVTGVVIPAMTNLEYSFEIGDPANGRALEYEDAPAAGYEHPATIISPWNQGSSWNIAFGDSVYGGRVTHVKVCIRHTNFLYRKMFTRTFYVIGAALSPGVRNAYINGLVAYEVNIRAMARAIAVKESGGTHYWDGSGNGIASHLRYPQRERRAGNVIGPGYGVMHLTSPEFLNRDSIWNWKRNIDTAIAYAQICYNNGVTHLSQHPQGVTDEMRRREGYARYNGGPTNRYYWWSQGPAINNGVAAGWTRFGYVIPAGGHWPVYRDYNNDGVRDPAGNRYNITPDGPTGANVLRDSATRYADVTMGLE